MQSFIVRNVTAQFGMLEIMLLTFNLAKLVNLLRIDANKSKPKVAHFSGTPFIS